MKTQRLLLTLLALTFIMAPPSPRSAFAARREVYGAKLISPKPGDVVFPGQVVRIEWTAVFPRVDLTLCEADLFLSIDGGRTFTVITEQRNPAQRYFDWTVPRTPTRMAILDVRFGCLGIYPETSSVQSQAAFVISSEN